MKRFVAVGIIAALLVIIFSPSVQDALVLFVIAGVMPGTAWEIPSALMIAGLSFAMALALFAMYRQARAVKLPAIEEKPRKARASRSKKSVRRRRDTFRPQLKLLQQKLIAFTRICGGVAMKLQRKLGQISLQTSIAIRFPSRVFGFAKSLRKMTTLISKK